MRRGFTFVELMIVVGMIVLLAALLVPAAMDAKEEALDVGCRSNLRQLALVCFEYSQREGVFPWGMIEPSTHDETYCKGELAQILYPRERPERHGISSWSEYASFCWDFRRLAGADKGWQCGEMFGSWRMDDVMCCPKCRQERSDNWDGNRMTGYNYNVCFLGRVENDKGSRMYPTRFDDVLHPDRVVVFGDGGYSGGPNKFMRAPSRRPSATVQARSATATWRFSTATWRPSTSRTWQAESQAGWTRPRTAHSSALATAYTVRADSALPTMTSPVEFSRAP